MTDCVEWPVEFCDVRVDYYGSPTRITQVAKLYVEEREGVSYWAIRPYDASLCGEIEKAILRHPFGLPMSDGKVIRLRKL